MATTEKKYLSLEGLQQYDAKIKAKIDEKDAAILAQAKQYTDEAPFDPAGTAAQKVQELANGQVKTNTEAIAAINNEDTGILKQSKDYTDGQVLALTNGAVKTAQDGVNANAEAIETLETDTAEMKGKIAALEAGTYDDTEVRGLISDNAEAIDALEGSVSAVEGKVTVLIGDDSNKSVRTIANEELAKQLIAENAAENLNELQEIAAWIQSHPNDASAMNKAISDLTALVGTLPSGVTATTIVGYIQEAVAAEKTRAEAAESALAGRVGTIEGNIGTGTVDSRIETAKTAAIEAAAADAKTKDDAVLASAKSYTDEKFNAVDLSGITTNANAISALTGRMGSAESDIDALEASLATGGATATAIAAAQKAGDDAAAAVTTLETGKVAALRTDVDALMSVSYVEITTAEINALFAA